MISTGQLGIVFTAFNRPCCKIKGYATSHNEHCEFPATVAELQATASDRNVVRNRFSVAEWDDADSPLWAVLDGAKSRFSDN